MNRLSPLMLLLAAAFLLAGCNSPNYINVPGVSGDIAFNDANSSTAVLMEKRALSTILERAAIPGDVAIRFPEGTSQLTAITVVAELPDNAFLDGQAPSDEYTLVEVVKIRARGQTGTVDVIRPGQTRARFEVPRRRLDRAEQQRRLARLGGQDLFRPSDISRSCTACAGLQRQARRAGPLA